MATKGTHQGTTHQSRHSGHGPKIRRTRFAIPTTGRQRGVPIKGHFEPWYLKRALSKPEDKRIRPLEAAAG